ncbi:formate dehydrogenase subunit beta [Escherichia coli]
MAYQSQDIIRRSATNGLTPAPGAGLPGRSGELIDVTTCIGCKACQVACSEWNDIRDTVGNNIGVYDNPHDLSAKSWTVMRFSEVEQNDKLEMADPQRRLYALFRSRLPESVPGGGAIIQYANGIVDFQSEQCIGCGYCIAGCPFDIPRLNPEDNRVYKRTLCVDRVVVGQEPACVKTCPTGAIHFGTKESMKTLASERVAELKTRGYDNAGLYDPAGVGGTHVMYVLHHADKPNLYHGLPENPESAKPVWKGIWKPLAAVGFAATFAASIFHYVGVGPNRADEEENNLHEEKDEQRK